MEYLTVLEEWMSYIVSIISVSELCDGVLDYWRSG